jgi:hypothetical protein
MTPGAWHQFGDRSQKLALEQLQDGTGVGIVVSPRDISRSGLAEYLPEYKECGAQILIDLQFYVPGSRVGKLSTYEFNRFRRNVSGLANLSSRDFEQFEIALNHFVEEIEPNGIIAPGIVYEAGREDILDVNHRLLEVAISVGHATDLPVYSCVVLGASTLTSDEVLWATLSSATSLQADGWYFAQEMGNDRIPSNLDIVRRCCEVILTLASTGLPVLHAFAGPMGVISPVFGASAIGVGHSQNVWKFARERWHPPSGSGGGGDAPARLFCPALWGTIVYPDEFLLLPPRLRTQIYSPSPYSRSVSVATPQASWNRWDANKHLVHHICRSTAPLFQSNQISVRRQRAESILRNAITLHQQISHSHVTLKDATNSYQQVWLNVIEDIFSRRRTDIDYLQAVLSS